MEEIDLEQKKTMLKDQACFSKLTTDELSELSGLLKTKIFKPGETIVKEGDIVDSVYLIVEGTADVQHISIHDGQTQIQSIATLGPKNAIGLNETGFYSLSGVRTATVAAKTDMITLQLSVAAFHGFSLIHRHVLEVMRTYARSRLGVKYSSE